MKHTIVEESKEMLDSNNFRIVINVQYLSGISISFIVLGYGGLVKA